MRIPRLICFLIGIAVCEPTQKAEEEAEVHRRLEHTREIREKALEKKGRSRGERGNGHYFGPRLRTLKSEMEVNEEKGAADDLFQGDIRLTLAQVKSMEKDLEKQNSRARRSTTSNSAYKWDRQNAIPWFFDKRYPESNREDVRSAFQFWEKNSCLTFKENGSGAHKLRVVANGQGCQSAIGIDLTAPVQDLSLDGGCFGMGVASHEIGHALGFYHTISRKDRDGYVRINMEKMDPEWFDNYAKQSDESPLGVAYDLGSVMHYPKVSFGGVTNLEGKDWRYARWMGQRVGPSFSDVKLMNKFYLCEENCPNKSGKCAHNGIVNSKDCGKCICPIYFSGDNCERLNGGANAALADPKLKSCSETIKVTSTPTDIQREFGYEDWEEQEEFIECFLHFVSDSNKKIVFDVESAGLEQNFLEECDYSGVEINTGRWEARGMLLCEPNRSENATVRSEGSEVVLRAYTKLHKFKFSLKNIRAV